MHTGTHKPNPLSLFGVIADKEKLEKVLKVLEGQKVFFSLVTIGKGTANSKILGYLGLGETDKRVVLSILPAPVASQAMDKLDETLQFSKPGHGVAFKTQIHEGCYHRLVHIPQEENGGQAVEQQKSACDLIMVVVNRGYTEEVMDAARSAGATGGTVIHARGCGLSGAEKFFGVTIQPEKEMILILAKNEVSCGIMQEIATQTGPESDAGAVSFSLPANRVMGIGRDVPDSVL